MSQSPREIAHLLKSLRELERIDLAQFIAGAVDDMVAEEVSAEEISKVCSSICKRLGVTPEDLRRALH